jgi:hypothetical protein
MTATAPRAKALAQHWTEAVHDRPELSLLPIHLDAMHGGDVLERQTGGAALRRACYREARGEARAHGADAVRGGAPSRIATPAESDAAPDANPDLTAPVEPA